MKKIFYFFIALMPFASITTKAQTTQQAEVIPANYPPVSFDGDILTPPPPVVLQNCNPSSPGDFDYYNNIGNYIPNNNTPTKEIQIALNIFQKSDGSGNFQDTLPDKQALIQLIGWLNDNYKTGDGPSDTIINPLNELPDRHIQFSLGTPGNERIYFYQDPTNTLWDGNCNQHSGDFAKAAWGSGSQAVTERQNYMNVYFTEGAVCGGITSVQITSGGSKERQN